MMTRSMLGGCCLLLVALLSQATGLCCPESIGDAVGWGERRALILRSQLANKSSRRRLSGEDTNKEQIFSMLTGREVAQAWALSTQSWLHSKLKASLG